MNDTVILNGRKATRGIDDSATGLTRSNSGAETGQTLIRTRKDDGHPVKQRRYQRRADWVSGKLMRSFMRSFLK